MLSFRERRIARSAARRAWIEANGSGDDALAIFGQDPRIVGLDPALIALLIQIAIKLIEYWIKNNTDEPSEVWQPGEPFYDEVNDAD
jgi:hypothetical protein